MREHPVEQVPLRHPASRLLLLLIVVASTAISGVARAHAKLVTTEPPDGAVLATPPARLVLCFDGEIEARYPRFTLTGPDGGEVPLPGTLRADARCFDVPLPTTRPGAWRVGWSVVSRDSHRIGGTTGFVVTAGGPGGR